MIAIAADEGGAIVQPKILSDKGYGRAYEGEQSGANFSNLDIDLNMVLK